MKGEIVRKNIRALLLPIFHKHEHLFDGVKWAALEMDIEDACTAHLAREREEQPREYGRGQDGSMWHVPSLQEEVRLLRAQAAAHAEKLSAERTLRRIHDACRESAEREVDEQKALVGRLVVALEKSKRSHLVVEDCWYSCPKSGECCNDESDKTKCDCGADAYNAGVDALLAELAPTPESRG